MPSKQYILFIVLTPHDSYYTETIMAYKIVTDRVTLTEVLIHNIVITGVS